VRRARRSGSAPDTRPLIRGFAQAARLPWFLATSEDKRIDGVTGARDPGLLGVIGGRYVDAVLLDAVRSPLTLRRFSEVNNLVRPPVALLDPVVLARVMSSALSRRLDARRGR
jgi:hypothetical protein